MWLNYSNSASLRLEASTVDLVMFAGYLALVTAALFTGAAFYVSFAELPLMIVRFSQNGSPRINADLQCRPRSRS